MGQESWTSLGFVVKKKNRGGEKKKGKVKLKYKLAFHPENRGAKFVHMQICVKE
jgi:hypothetical protein